MLDSKEDGSFLLSCASTWSNLKRDVLLTRPDVLVLDSSERSCCHILLLSTLLNKGVISVHCFEKNNAKDQKEINLLPN